MPRRKSFRPDQGEVRIGIAAVGVGPLGTQVAGVVDAVGPESAGFARGDRVTFRATARLGRRVVVGESELMGVPADVSLDAAAAVLPYATLARTVVKQVHRVRRGDRVRVQVTGPLRGYLAAWVRQVGASVVDRDADLAIDDDDLEVARAMRQGHGSAQQTAADVFAAIRAGVFDGADPAARLLHPAEVTLAA